MLQRRPAAEEAVERLERQLAALEESFHTFQDESWKREEERGRRKRDQEDSALARTELAREELVRYQQQFLAPDLNRSGKVRTLRFLRRFPEEMRSLDPIMDHIVDELRSEDRQGLERYIDAVTGIEDERLIEPLLRLLGAKEDGVRCEAVSALRPFLTYPEVRTALLTVSQETVGNAPRRARQTLAAWEVGE